MHGATAAAELVAADARDPGRNLRSGGAPNVENRFVRSDAVNLMAHPSGGGEDEETVRRHAALSASMPPAFGAASALPPDPVEQTREELRVLRKRCLLYTSPSPRDS